MPTTVERVLLSNRRGPAHPEAAFGEVELPAGYRRVFRGAVKPGDVYLHARLFALGGTVHWLPVEEFPPPGQPYAAAEWFLLLIRPGDPAAAPDRACERCRAFVRLPNELYCRDCRAAVLREVRKAGAP